MSQQKDKESRQKAILRDIAAIIAAVLLFLVVLLVLLLKITF